MRDTTKLNIDDFEDHQLPDPEPLTRDLPDEQPFPVDALGPDLGPVVKTLSWLIDIPEAMAAQSVQAAVSTVIQNHVNVELPLYEYKSVPTSEFFLGIGPSGSRKTETDKKAANAIYRRQDYLTDSYRENLHAYIIKKTAWESTRKQIADNKKLTKDDKETAMTALGHKPDEPLEPTFLCAEPTMEGLYKDLALGQPGIGIFTSEGSEFIGGYALGKEQRTRTGGILSKLWGGESLDRIRGGDRSLPRRLKGRRCTICIQVQPDIVKGFLLDPQLKGQGLLSRFLMAYPRDRIGNRYPIHIATEQEEGILKDFDRRLYDLLCEKLPLVDGKTNELNPRTLQLPDKATKLFDTTYKEIEKGTVSGEGSADFRSKFMEHAARQAAQLAMFEDPETKIVQARDLENGIELTRYYLSERERIFDNYYVPENIRMALQLLAWLTTKWDEDLVSLPDIQQFGPNAIRTVDLARSTVGTLESHNHLYRVVEGGIIKGVKRREVWRIIKKLEL